MILEIQSGANKDHIRDISMLHSQVTLIQLLYNPTSTFFKYYITTSFAIFLLMT